MSHPFKRRGSCALLLLHVHAHQVHLDYPHKLGHEGLEMEDDLGPRSYPVLVEGGPPDDLPF